MMSSSRRKHPTTVSSRPAAALLFLAVAALAVAGGEACRRDSGGPLLTYYNGQYRLSVKYPFGWKTESAEQEGVWYRYFLSPPTAPDNRPSLSVTLLSGELKGTLEDYAQSYLAGNPVMSTREETRAGAKGRSWRFTSKNGSMHHSLVLIAAGGRVHGLYAQGASGPFAAAESVIVAMEESLNIETPALYPLIREVSQGYSLRIPPTWEQTQKLSSQGKSVVQYTSPALGAERNRQTVHASLTLTVEPLKPGVDLEQFYSAAMAKHGDTFLVVSHEPWRGGYADLVRMETSMASSELRRFFRVDGGKAYTLSFEGRDDIFPRVSPWCDLIASTLMVGSEIEAK
jgi:hypothetical protein